MGEVGAIEGCESVLWLEGRSRNEGGGGEEVVGLAGFELDDLGLDPGNGGGGEHGVSPGN